MKALKEILKHHGITQKELAEVLGFPHDVYANRLLNGLRRLQASEAILLQKFLESKNINFDIFTQEALKGAQRPVYDPSEVMNVPVMGRIETGYIVIIRPPSRPLGSLPIPKEVIPDGAVMDDLGTFEVCDHAMEPTIHKGSLVGAIRTSFAGFLSGDHVVLHSGDIVIAQRKTESGTETIMREALWSPDGPVLTAHSKDDCFPPIRISEEVDYRVVGKVIWIGSSAPSGRGRIVTFR